MKYLDILRAQRAALDEQRAAAVTDMEGATTAAASENRSELNDAEKAAFEDAKATVARCDSEADELDGRIAELEQIDARTTAAAKAPAFQHKRQGDDPFDVLEDRNAKPRDLADAATRALHAELGDIPEMDNVRRLLKKHAGDQRGEWARNVLARAHPDYLSAFEKIMRANGGYVSLSAEEQRAIVVGTNTSGGFLVPTVIDPTLIYTNNGSDNAIRAISTEITLTGDANAVNVITSAGITASWDGELVEVSDDSPAVARPSIPIFKAAAFVMASIEATQDMGSLFDGAGALTAMFQDAKDRLEGAAFATGNGTTAPKGIFTALDANTNVELATTTAGAVSRADLERVRVALPTRWRRKASWLSSPYWGGVIQGLGTQLGASYSGDLREPVADVILGHRWYQAEDAPSTVTTTALDNIVAFGDFSNYIIVNKPASMAVEYIPHIFGNTNSRPIGARGWYAYWRTGADAPNPLAFRLLQDTTSA